MHHPLRRSPKLSNSRILRGSPTSLHHGGPIRVVSFSHQVSQSIIAIWRATRRSGPPHGYIRETNGAASNEPGTFSGAAFRPPRRTSGSFQDCRCGGGRPRPTNTDSRCQSLNLGSHRKSLRANLGSGHSNGRFPHLEYWLKVGTRRLSSSSLCRIIS
jgi:hypothetical protein